MYAISASVPREEWFSSGGDSGSRQVVNWFTPASISEFYIHFISLYTKYFTEAESLLYKNIGLDAMFVKLLDHNTPYLAGIFQLRTTAELG